MARYDKYITSSKATMLGVLGNPICSLNIVGTNSVVKFATSRSNISEREIPEQSIPEHMRLSGVDNSSFVLAYKGVGSQKPMQVHSHKDARPNKVLYFTSI